MTYNVNFEKEKLNHEILKYVSFKSKFVFFTSLFLCAGFLFLSELPKTHPAVYLLLTITVMSSSAALATFGTYVNANIDKISTSKMIAKFLRLRGYLSLSIALLVAGILDADGLLSYAGVMAALGWAIHHELHVAVSHPMPKFSYIFSALMIVIPIAGFSAHETNFQSILPFLICYVAYGVNIALKARLSHKKFISHFLTNSSLLEENKRIENLIDLIPAHVSWFDSQMKYLLVNKSLAQLQKREKKDFVGQRLGFQSKTDTEMLQYLERFVQDEDVNESYFELSLHTDTGPRWHEFYLKKIRTEDEKFEVVMLGLDREEEKRVSRQLEEERIKNVHSARLASLGEMGAGIAHEIKNPLTIILGQVAFCKKELSVESVNREKLGQRVDKIEQTAYRILKIIEGLRKLSRDSTEQEMSWVTVADILSDPINLVSEKLRVRGVDLVVENEIQNLELQCQPLQISQVILNLINNADDIIKNQDVKKIHVRAYKKEDHYFLSVEDNGPGVKDENKLFTPFYTTKDPGSGTGLGLSISKKILEKNHGSLFYSRENGMTCFLLQFPESSAREKQQGPVAA